MSWTLAIVAGTIINHITNRAKIPFAPMVENYILSWLSETFKLYISQYA